MTEIYESVSIINATVNPPLLKFLPYKLWFASYLFDLGYNDKCLNYLQNIFNILRTLEYNVIPKVFVDSLYDFSDRIANNSEKYRERLGEFYEILAKFGRPTVPTGVSGILFEDEVEEVVLKESGHDEIMQDLNNRAVQDFEAYGNTHVHEPQYQDEFGNPGNSYSDYQNADPNIYRDYQQTDEYFQENYQEAGNFENAVEQPGNAPISNDANMNEAPPMDQREDLGFGNKNPVQNSHDYGYQEGDQHTVQSTAYDHAQITYGYQEGNQNLVQNTAYDHAQNSYGYQEDKTSPAQTFGYQEDDLGFGNDSHLQDPVHTAHQEEDLGFGNKAHANQENDLRFGNNSYSNQPAPNTQAQEEDLGFGNKPPMQKPTEDEEDLGFGNSSHKTIPKETTSSTKEETKAPAKGTL
jgi:hypothetical protein